MRSLLDSARPPVLLVATAVLLACGASEPADEPAEETMDALTEGAIASPAPLDPTLAAALEAAEREAIDQLPPGPGQELISGTCVTCHDSAIIQQQRKDRDAWTRSVQKMVEWGAPLSAEQEEIAIDYLAEHFGAER